MIDQEQNASNKANSHDSSQPAEEKLDKQEEVAFESATNPKQIFITDEGLRTLQKELLDYKDKYLRLLADAENARKRLHKERQELSRYAIESMVVDLLRPLDNLENALRFAQDMSDEVKNWAFGFQMILTQFKDVLTQHGIHAFDSLGQPFDPHQHEAIEMVESTTQTAGTIVEENVRGYKMGDRIIRAARVKVAKNSESSATPQG